MSVAIPTSFDDRTLLQIAVAELDVDRARLAWDMLLHRLDGADGFLSWVSGDPCERLLPLLDARAALLDIPERVAERCGDETAMSWGLNVRLFEVIGAVIEGWRTEGVSPVTFKGVGLVGDVHPDHRRRAVGDADLLIRYDEVRPALSVLERTGWELPWRAVDRLRFGAVALGVRHPSGVGLDLHLRPSRNLPYLKPADTYPVEPVPVAHPLASTGLLRLAPPAHLLVLCAHLARPENRHLGHPLVDLYRFVTHNLDAHGSLRVKDLLGAARRSHVEYRVAEVLAHLCTVFDPSQLGALGGVRVLPVPSKAESRAIVGEATRLHRQESADHRRTSTCELMRRVSSEVRVAGAGQVPTRKFELAVGYAWQKLLISADSWRRLRRFTKHHRA